MSTSTRATPATTAPRSGPIPSDAHAGRRRWRAMIVTALIALGSFGLAVDLLLVGHTSGEELWGPVTAVFATLVGALSLAFLAARGRRRLARWALYALWLLVAFFGYGGYNDHQRPLPEGTVDGRSRPPLAPLVFTGLGIAGAVTLRIGTRER